jgi:transposase
MSHPYYGSYVFLIYHLKSCTSAKFIKKLRYITAINGKAIAFKRHMKSGRPKNGEQPCVVGYRIEGEIACLLTTKAELEKSKGYFILATNDLEEISFPCQEVLKTYKAQQSVERGFRFLKSPDFLVSSFFLKKPARIEALLMVMTLCLLIYISMELLKRGKRFLIRFVKTFESF